MTVTVMTQAARPHARMMQTLCRQPTCKSSTRLKIERRQKVRSREGLKKISAGPSMSLWGKEMMVNNKKLLIREQRDATRWLLMALLPLKRVFLCGAN